MRAALLIAVLLMAAMSSVSLGSPIAAHQKHKIDCVACHGSNNPVGKPNPQPCISCHGSLSAVSQKTSSFDPNPHASHMGDAPCLDCHKIHNKTEPVCNDCHQFTFKK